MKGKLRTIKESTDFLMRATGGRGPASANEISVRLANLLRTPTEHLPNPLGDPRIGDSERHQAKAARRSIARLARKGRTEKIIQAHLRNPRRTATIQHKRAKRTGE